MKKMQAYNKENAERLFKKSLKALEKLQKGFSEWWAVSKELWVAIDCSVDLRFGDTREFTMRDSWKFVSIRG